MNHETALKLKEHGFPQRGRNQDGYDFSENGGDVYIPLLEELIDACGDKFTGFVNNEGTWVAGKLQGWDDGSVFVNDEKMEGKGSTPTEAVANLWLALNPKQK